MCCLSCESAVHAGEEGLACSSASALRALADGNDANREAAREAGVLKALLVRIGAFLYANTCVSDVRFHASISSRIRDFLQKKQVLLQNGHLYAPATPACAALTQLISDNAVNREARSVSVSLAACK